MLGIKELPKTERPREKMIALGASALSNQELLAVIIASGNKTESALSIAARVLALEPDGLRELALCSPEEFMRIRGVGYATACRICASAEFGRRMAYAPSEKRIKLGDPSVVAETYMGEMRGLRQEKLCVAMINSKGEVIAREDVSLGGLYSTSASPREVFAGALRKGAYGIILVHNHPSGDPSPSKEDIEVTKKVAAAGKLMEIKLLDHVIIGDGNYVSLKSLGLL